MLGVLHLDGFAAVTPAQLKGDRPIQLKSWGKVDLTIQHAKNQPQSAGLRVTVQPAGTSVPLHFQVFTAETTDGPVSRSFLMPPGNVNVQRILSNSGLAADSIKVAPGETQRFELGPPTDADVQRAREIQEKSRGK